MEITKKSDMLWTAVRVKPRTEKIVKSHCGKFDIPAYLPLRRRVRRYQRRKVETYLPMFPGYLFVQVDEASYRDLHRSHKIVWIASVSEGPQEDQLIQELHDIQKLEELANRAEIMVQPEIKPGTPVLITSGPLRGTEGIVEQRHNTTRVTINVDILGQSASVDMDVGEIEIDTA